MEDITIRFIEAYNYLKTKGIVKNATKFALELGVSSSMLTEITKGRSNPGVKILQNLVNIYDINGDWILTGFGDINKSNTPLYESDSNVISVVNEYEPPYLKALNASPTASPTASPPHNLGVPFVVIVNDNDDDLISFVTAKAAAGYLNGYADPEYVEHLPTIKIPNLKGGTHRAFEVTGHSMKPTIYNGSIAFGRWVESFGDIRDRRIYIIVTKTKGIVIKRVLNRIEVAGKLILVSDNQNKKEYPNILLDPDDVIEMWYHRTALSFEFPEPTEFNDRLNNLEAQVTLLADKLQQLPKH